MHNIPPPTNELFFNKRQIVEHHPNLLTGARVERARQPPARVFSRGQRAWPNINGLPTLSQ
jgi:hypothetical protein